MVIEHVFVTTLDAPDALRLASEFLTANGFAVQGQGGFQLGGWTSLEVARGKANAGRARNIEELPQRVKVEWDRGRVTVAAYIQAFAGRQSFQIGTGSELPPDSPKARLHAHLMMAIAQGLEILLAHRRPAEEAIGPWQAVAAEIQADAAARKRKGRLGLIVLFVVIGLLVLLAIYANTVDRS